jgi:putative toxin-antitoxin system antitoxin component (TIGR02293 family)
MPGAAAGVATATAKKLSEYFEDWLGTSAQSEQEIIRLVEAGLPLKVIARLIQRGLSRDEVFHIIINPRTLKHRRSKHQPLSKEESERAVRAVRILARAQAVLGDPGAALRWLRAPKKRFEGRPPLEMLSTETGGRMVEQMLVQIDEGMFA